MTGSDDDLRDAWLDAALEEKLGGAAAPDPTAELRGASRAAVGRRRRLLAAAVVLLGLGVLGAVAALRDTTERSGQRQDPVSAPPVRVLYLEDAPRWEYRFSRNVLLRARPSIRLQTFLFGKDPDREQDHSEGLPSLDSAPRSRAELARYDVILVGDVAPARFGVTAEEQAAFATALAAFVRDGGGVGFLCGANAMPQSWRGTELEDLLPVRLDESTRWLEAGGEGCWFQLTAAGGEHPVIQLADDSLTTAQRLCDLRFHARAALGAARPEATVLAVGPDGRPLFVVGSVGRGRTLLLATDETWRLRSHGERYYGRLWKQIVLWLAGREL